jgi:hypothetical protein
LVPGCNCELVISSNSSSRSRSASKVRPGIL